jgi:ribosomal protein S18 acetylase RimI-like enzyme
VISEIAIQRIDCEQKHVVWEALARLHEDQIDGGFLASLGTRTLALLYSRLARSPRAVLFVATTGGHDPTVVGFICGSTDTGKVYKDIILRSWPQFLPRILPKLFSLGAAKRIAETLLYPAKKPPAPDLPKSEILNFCVSGTAQRKGVGRALFNALMTEFRRQEITACKIVTGASQVKAQRFYDALGAVRVATFEVHQGTQSVLYTFNIR